MLTLETLNSAVSLSPELEKYIVGKTGFLAEVWRRTPVFLVDPQLFEAICPPERRRVLNEEGMRRRIWGEDSFENRETRRVPDDDPREFWHRLSECWTEERTIPCVAVFRYELTARDINVVKSFSGKTISAEPSVFICCERMFKWAESLVSAQGKVSGHFKVMMAWIVCHELAHAYMQTPMERYRTVWGRIIEESLANAIAYSRFTSPGDLGIVTRAIAQQPLEYRGYVYWIEFPKNKIRTYAGAWKDPDSLGFDEFLDWQDEYFWYWRRVPHELRMRIERFRHDPDTFWQEVARRITLDILHP